MLVLENNHLYQLLDISKELHFIFDLQIKKVVYSNQSVENHFGISSNNNNSLSLSFLKEFVHYEDLYKIYQIDFEREGASGTVFIRLQRQDQTMAPYSITYKVRKDLIHQKLLVYVQAEPLKEANFRPQKQAFDYKDLFDHVPLGVAIHEGPEFVTTMANKAYYQIAAGKGPILGKRVVEIWPEIAESIIPLLEQVYITGMPYQVIDKELYLHRDQGMDQTFFSFSYIPLKNASGKTIAIQALVQETTNMVKTRREKEILSNRYKAIYKNIKDGILMLDKQGNLLEANQVALDMHHFDTVQEFNSFHKEFEEYFELQNLAGHQIPRQEWPINKALKGEKIRNLEIKLYRKDIDKSWYVLYSAFPLFDQHQQVIGCVVTINDRTEKRIYENKLEDLASRYRIIFETVDEGLFLINPEGKILEANQLGLKMHGYHDINEFNDEVAKYSSRVHLYNLNEKEVPLEQWPSIRSLKGEPVFNFQGFLKRIDTGEKMTISATSIPVISREGDIMAVVLSMRNITELKGIEEEREKLLNETKSTNQLLENLMYIAAHDLKGPVSNLKALLEMMKLIQSDQEKLDFIPRFRVISNQLVKTIGGLTEILQIQNIDESHIKTIDLANLTEHLLSFFNESILRCNGQLTYDFSQAGQVVYIESFLESVLKNLISNAIKYRDKKIPLSIHLKSTRENGFVMISIKDNGIGIDLDSHKNNLFKPFRRFTDQEQGTGVGLYLIKNMITKNGGDIKIESKLNQGSTFHCFLKEY
ncbi:MAG: PAS domain-containing protein [Candidatus Cyclobacteriaceae bacterium M3_2C_046]